MPPESSSRLIARALLAAAIGAVAGAIGLAVAASTTSNLTFDFDRDPPSFASGFYPAERHRDETFVWTTARASLTLPDLDRGADWRCSVRLRGARPAGVAQPLVAVVVDGVALSRREAPADYETVEVLAPARPSRHGLSLSIESDPTFIPSASDRRQLGVQVDRVSCAPQGMVMPPAAALRATAVAAAVFTAAFAVIGAPMWLMVLGAIALAVPQSVALTLSGAMHSGYPARVGWLAAVSALILVGVTKTIGRLGMPLSPPARFVAAFSVAAVYVKLLALLHPSKLIIDAVFHARRLDWVLDGRFYFTQPLPDGVAFPYAIGLYLFAAPWSLLTNDHVTLLRVVVTSAEAGGGVLLYLMIVRAWGDRAAAACAVVLFHLVPLPYLVIGNANMTNAFGQSVALAATAMAATMTFRRSFWWQLVALTLVATLAYLSHVSIVTALPFTLIAIGVLNWWRGGADGKTRARAVAIAAIGAGVLAVALYYAHFGEAYRSLARVRAQAAPAAGVQGAGPPPPPTVPIHRRVATALAITVKDIGWPILVLAGVGVIQLRRIPRGDPLVLVLVAWAITYVVFVAFATLMPVGARFERYAAEFVGRMDFATYPAAVILAARGAVWMLRERIWIRVPAGMLVILAGALAVEQWLAWIR